MKENKVTDESGMIAEYVKALWDMDLNNLMRLLNDVLMEGCISKEWKESKVVLVYKENIVCLLFLLIWRSI